MRPSPTATHQHLAVEAELTDGPLRFVRERLRLPLGQEASFGWLRHPPSVMVVPRLADGRLLLVRRWRPAVGRWVLEFPAAPLACEEAPARGASRLLRDLLGSGEGLWHPLGELRPNPGYSDERMALGWLALKEDGAALDALPTAAGELAPPEETAMERRFYAPAALNAVFTDLEEPVDGRSVSAWFLAQRGGIG